MRSALVLIALLGLLAAHGASAQDYVLIKPEPGVTLEGELWEATVLVENPSTFVVQRSYKDVDDWQTLTTVDREVTVTADANKVTISLLEALSRWFSYRFRVVIKPTEGGDAFLTESFFVEIPPTNQVLLQPPQRNLGESKHFAIYWQPPGTDYPEFARTALRTVGKAQNGAPIGYFLDMASGGTSAVLSLSMSTTVNSFFEIISEYCALTFAQGPVTSSDVSTARSKLSDVVTRAMRLQYPGQDYSFVFASDTQPVRSADKLKPYTFLFYVRSFTTGAPVENSKVRVALGLALAEGELPGFDSEILTQTGGVQSLDKLSVTMAAVNLGAVTSFALHKYSTLRSNANFFIRAKSATELETKVSEFGADDNTHFNLVPGAVDPTQPSPFGTTLYTLQSTKYPGSSVAYTITGYSNTGGAIVSFALAAVGSTFSLASNGAYYLTDSISNTDSFVWAAQRCAEFTTESLLPQNVQTCQAASNNPTYRRMEVDLNGVFGVTTVSIQMPNYPFPSDLSLAGALPAGASNSTKSRLELWASVDGKTYVDFTDSVDDSAKRCSNGEPSKAGSPCTVAFAVQDYTRSTLGKSGNFGWRYFRIVFGGMERQSDRLLTSDRYYAASEIKFTGYCICNGHSNKCDYATGRCLEADGGGITSDINRCQHKTAGDHCEVCEPNTYRNPTNDVPTTIYNCDVADPDGACDGPALSEITPVEIESMQYRYGSRRGEAIVSVDASNVRFQYALAFQIFFPVLGPCVDCFCYGHSIFDRRADTSNRNIAGCDEFTSVCSCDPSSNVHNGAMNKCELCNVGYCRACNATSDETCRFEVCKACECNLHAVQRLPNGKDFCAADGCGCNCRPEDNVEGAQCEKCKGGYWSVSGDGVNGVTCSKCQCNGHKPAAVVGTGQECAVLGGNCDMDGSKCIDNTEGHNCQCCKPGFYRDSDDPTLPCKPCACNGHGDATHLWDFKNGCGVQAAECNPIGGVCACLTAHKVHGDHCEACNVGTWNDVGDSKDGRSCTDCFCFGHKGAGNECAVKGGDCNFKYDGTTKDPCQGNTVGHSCEVCRPSYKYVDRTKKLNDVGTNYPTAPADDIRFQNCQQCNCNGHSAENPDVGSGICNPVTGICINCVDNTVNGEDGECERCAANFFRNLQGHYDGSKDTCAACSLTSGSCATETLASPCRPCSAQCFGSNKKCDEFTGQCLDCDKSNARGYRCERCVPGFYGDPWDGISCQKCLCYHSEPSLWTDIPNRNNVLSAPLRCDLDTTKEKRGCVLDRTTLTPAVVAAISGAAANDANVWVAQQAAISCNCPLDQTNGTFGAILGGTMYTGSQCSACNPQGYFGRPTVCKTPNAAGQLVPGGPNACSAFFECTSCLCNRNIDTSLEVNNCADNNDALICNNCLGSTTGDQCELCKFGYYGNARRQDVVGRLGLGFVLDAQDNSLKCFKCDCNGQSTQRLVNFDGSDLPGIPGDHCVMTGEGNMGDFVCGCREDLGYTGPKCRQCMRGYVLKKGFNQNNEPDPAYDYCEPCPDCVRSAYLDGIIPLERTFAEMKSDIASLNMTVASFGTVDQPLMDLAQQLQQTFAELSERLDSIEAGGSCRPNPCLNGGACAVDATGLTVCKCKGIAKGLRCEDTVDQCAPNPCNNGGNCTDLANGYHCSCPKYFSGVNCEFSTPCSPNPCNGDTCALLDNQVVCICSGINKGPRCEDKIDQCATNPCQNGGTCTDAFNAFTCSCRIGWGGPTCTQRMLCEPNPCKNQGICDVVDGAPVCTCAGAAKGETCEESFNQCAPNPCLNGGECTDEIDGYSCACPPGVHGANCENMDVPDTCGILASPCGCEDGDASCSCSLAALFDDGQFISATSPLMLNNFHFTAEFSTTQTSDALLGGMFHAFDVNKISGSDLFAVAIVNGRIVVYLSTGTHICNKFTGKCPITTVTGPVVNDGVMYKVDVTLKGPLATVVVNVHGAETAIFQTQTSYNSSAGVAINTDAFTPFYIGGLDNAKRAKFPTLFKPLGTFSGTLMSVALNKQEVISFGAGFITGASSPPPRFVNCHIIGTKITCPKPILHVRKNTVNYIPGGSFAKVAGGTYTVAGGVVKMSTSEALATTVNTMNITILPLAFYDDVVFDVRVMDLTDRLSGLPSYTKPAYALRLGMCGKDIAHSEFDALGGFLATNAIIKFAPLASIGGVQHVYAYNWRSKSLESMSANIDATFTRHTGDYFVISIPNAVNMFGISVDTGYRPSANGWPAGGIPNFTIQKDTTTAFSAWFWARFGCGHKIVDEISAANAQTLAQLLEIRGSAAPPTLAQDMQADADVAMSLVHALRVTGLPQMIFPYDAAATDWNAVLVYRYDATSERFYVFDANHLGNDTLYIQWNSVTRKFSPYLTRFKLIRHYSFKTKRVSELDMEALLTAVNNNFVDPTAPKVVYAAETADLVVAQNQNIDVFGIRALLNVPPGTDIPLYVLPYTYGVSGRPLDQGFTAVDQLSMFFTKTLADLDQGNDTFILVSTGKYPSKASERCLLTSTDPAVPIGPRLNYYRPGFGYTIGKLSVKRPKQQLLTITLRWNLNDCDLDLYVTDPQGKITWYGNKQANTAGGGKLVTDNIDGYGPETFVWTQPAVANSRLFGKYGIQVQYFSDDKAVDGAAPRLVPFTITIREGNTVMTRISDFASTANATATGLFTGPSYSGPYYYTV